MVVSGGANWGGGGVEGVEPGGTFTGYKYLHFFFLVIFVFLATGSVCSWCNWW